MNNRITKLLTKLPKLHFPFNVGSNKEAVPPTKSSAFSDGLNVPGGSPISHEKPSENPFNSIAPVLDHFRQSLTPSSLRPRSSSSSFLDHVAGIAESLFSITRL